MSLMDKTGTLDPSGSNLAATDESSWDWYNKYVERASFPDSVVSPQSTLILAGPPIYAQIGGASSSVEENELLTPVGFVQNLQYREGQPVNRHFEVGSGRSKFTTGKSRGTGAISRALFDADSLLAVLMRNAPVAQGAPYVNTFFNNSSNFTYGFGLWSDAFKVPFGMAKCFKTVGNDYVASVFLEQCYIRDYNVTVSEGDTLVMENVTFVFDRVRAVNIRVAGPSGITDANA